jgi:uncharacterized membrane protein
MKNEDTRLIVDDILCAAPPELVLRTRLEVLREHHRHLARRSLLIRALTPSFAFVAMFCWMLREGDVNPEFNRWALVVVCFIFYACSMLVPWLVVRANRRGEQNR